MPTARALWRSITRYTPMEKPWSDDGREHVHFPFSSLLFFLTGPGLPLWGWAGRPPLLPLPSPSLYLYPGRVHGISLCLPGSPTMPAHGYMQRYVCGDGISFCIFAFWAPLLSCLFTPSQAAPIDTSLPGWNLGTPAGACTAAAALHLLPLSPHVSPSLPGFFETSQ